jgi:hypothetical protein
MKKNKERPFNTPKRREEARQKESKKQRKTGCKKSE